MSDETMGIKVGDIIQDTYEVISVLGIGGMGATFKGRNNTTGHLVAIKVMTLEFARNAKAAELFKRESSLLRTVQSDAVIRYETTLQDASGRLFLIMEYVEGRPLSYFVNKGARLESGDVMKLGARLADGLTAIHKLNIVHRDIAPDNILVPDNDVTRAKLIDFGLASNTVGSEKSIIGDSFAGKFSYSAPEQGGLFEGKVTAATDIYALGLVLMRISGISVPGEGKGIGALAERKNDIKINDPTISPVLKDILESLLKANPAERPKDLRKLFRQSDDREFATLENTGGGHSQVMRESSPKKGLLIASFAACCAAIFVGSYYYIFAAKPPLEGASVDQGQLAQAAVLAEDPLKETISLIEDGGKENLNAAFGALMSLANNVENDQHLRQRAYVLIARMYDPETHEVARSPFPTANVAAAKRMYQRAAELGSSAAKEALSRLSE